MGEFLRIYPKHKEKNSVYSCSFCETCDYQAAWEKYGDKGKGYAIGFRQSYFQPDEKGINIGSYIVTIKINYDCKDFRFLINHFLSLAGGILRENITAKHGLKKRHSVNELLGAHLASQLIPLMQGLKREKFINESKQRLYELEFKANGKFYPCEISSSRKINNAIVKSKKFSHNDIGEICAGPCVNFESAKNEISNIIKSSGYDESKIQILKSIHPHN